jgi:hypothetical protein
MNIYQFYGLVIAVGGIGATLCGLGLISPPKNTSEKTLNIYMFVGPVGFILGLLQYFGSRS